MQEINNIFGVTQMQRIRRAMCFNAKEKAEGAEVLHKEFELQLRDERSDNVTVSAYDNYVIHID